MDCFPISAEKVIESSYLKQYNKTLTIFYSEVVRFNTNLFILDKIIKFPFVIFGDGDGDIFFYFHVLNGLEVAVLIIYKLLRDTEPRAYSLIRFKNEIVRNIREEFRPDYHRHLINAKLDKNIYELLDRADKLRNNQIAHLSEATAIGRERFKRIHINELFIMESSLNRVYNTLCFNTSNMFLPIPYSPDVTHPVGTDSRPDIERILDNIALSSYWLNLPEKDPELWTLQKKDLGKYGIDMINMYRKKIGLPEI